MKPDLPSVQKVKTPAEILEEQRGNARPHVGEQLNNLMCRLTREYQEGSPFKWYLTRSLHPTIRQMCIEAVEAKGWKVTQTPDADIFDLEKDEDDAADAWYGTLKYQAPDGQADGLLVVKTNPEMESGYDIVSIQPSAPDASFPTGDEVYLLDEKQGWTWIGCLDGQRVSSHVQALDLLKIHRKSK